MASLDNFRKNWYLLYCIARVAFAGNPADAAIDLKQIYSSMKTRIAKQLLSAMLFPLSYLFAELPYEDVSGFLAQKGIKLAESDAYHCKAANFLPEERLPLALMRSMEEKSNYFNLAPDKEEGDESIFEAATRP